MQRLLVYVSLEASHEWLYIQIIYIEKFSLSHLSLMLGFHIGNVGVIDSKVV